MRVEIEKVENGYIVSYDEWVFNWTWTPRSGKMVLNTLDEVIEWLKKYFRDDSK